MSLPTVSLFGTINKIETRFSQSGTQITSFQIECSEKNKDGEWENLCIKGAVFNKAAEFVNNYFQDGSLCVATGKLVTEVYEGSDGKNKYEIKLKFPQIEFAPKAKNTENREKNHSGYANGSENTGVNAPVYQERKLPESNLPEIDDLEIPF